MKKFTKVLSAVLSAAMVVPSLPFNVAAAQVSTGVIDFAGETDGTQVNSNQYFKDYIYSDYGNMYVKDEALVTYAQKPGTTDVSQTMSFSLNAGKLSNVKTDGGVLTYKFKYKWVKNSGTPSDIAIKFGNKDSNDVNASHNESTGAGYFGVASLSYENGLKANSGGDKWSNPKTAWTDDFCEIQIKVDFYGKRVGFKEGDGAWHWTAMDSAHSGDCYMRLGFRGGLGSADKNSDFYIDDVSISYTTEPETLDTGAMDFENGPDTTLLSPLWTGSGAIASAEDPSGGVSGKVLKVSSKNTRNAGLKMNLSSWGGSNTGKGIITYEFDIYTNGNNVYFATNECSDPERLAVLTDTYLGIWASEGGGTLTQYKNDLNPSGWQHVKIALDRDSKKVTVHLNGNEQGSVTYKQDGIKDYIFTTKATNPDAGATSVEYYIDNLKATYSEKIASVGDVTHTWLGGIKVPFDTAMDKASVEADGGIVLKDNDAPKTVAATVIYNEATKTATVTPTETLDTSHSHMITIGDSVKTASGIYVSDAIDKNFTLEALQDVAINDSDITLFDESGTDLIKRVKMIKVKFNTPMDKTSLETAGHITLNKEGSEDTVPLRASYDMTNGNTVTLTLDEELEPNAKYYLCFSTDIARIDGTALANPITKTIDTPVLEKPQIVKDSVSYTDMLGTTGKMDAMKKRIGKVTIPFDVALDETTVTKDNVTIEGQTFDVGYDENNKAINIFLRAALVGDTNYTVSFSSDIKAVNGEPIADNSKTFVFKTATVDLPKIVSVTASADGTNFSDISAVADINSVKAVFNYPLNTTSAVPSTGNIKLEKQTDNGWVEVTEAIPKLENDTKTYTWSLSSGETLPEGTKFRIYVSDSVIDKYGDAPASDTYENFETKLSAAAKEMSVDILGKTITYSGKLLSGTDAEANKKMSVLLYKQGGSATPFGADTKHFEIIKTADDGSFGGSIKLHDDETSPVFSELWLAFDTQSMGKGNARDARVAVQYANAKMSDAGITDLKKSTKQVLTYITEAADSDDMKAIVPSNGLTASQNKKLYESMGVWVDKYEALSTDEKAAANNSLDSYKQTMTAENIAKITNASITAADYLSLTTSNAVDMISKYDSEIEEIAVEDTNFSDLSSEQQTWVASNVKQNNANGFDNYEVFVKEVRKSMLLSMIGSTPYTELRELLINNKDLVNDGLSENKLSSLESETDTKITDAAMQTIKLANQNSKYTNTTKLANDVATAVSDAKSNASGKDDNTNKNDKFTVGGGGGGGGSYTPDNKKDDEPTTEPEPDENNSVDSKVFGDIAGYEWAENAIMTLYDKGIISGTGEGTFEPERGVTREEFLKLVCEAFGFEVSDKGTAFDDVKSGEWYEKYISAAVDLGIVKGVSETEFGIGSLVTREDMAVMIFRAMETSGRQIDGGGKTFADKDEISDYALEAVERLGGMGIINGVGDNRFAPTNNATRAEAAVIINRCLQ